MRQDSIDQRWRGLDQTKDQAYGGPQIQHKEIRVLSRVMQPCVGCRWLPMDQSSDEVAILMGRLDPKLQSIFLDFNRPTVDCQAPTGSDLPAKIRSAAPA